MADLRTGRRFPVQLPIRMRVHDSDEERAGTTANVSAAGVYIRTDAPKGRKGAVPRKVLRRGSVVEFEMTLPAAVVGARQDVHIRCRGRVMRVDKLPGERRSGVACVIDKYEFVRKG